jgi:hypothetical protein
LCYENGKHNNKIFVLKNVDKNLDKNWQNPTKSFSAYNYVIGMMFIYKKTNSYILI